MWRLYYNDDYYDYGVEDPNKYELCKTVERNNPGILDAMHRVEELGMHISIKSTVSPDESMNMTSKPITTYFDNGNCMAREWDTWNEQCVTTTYICECSVDSTVKNVSDMLSIISGVFGAISKVCKTVKIGDKIVETASDISTDTGIASSLGSLFDEHKVLFTIDLGSKIEYSRTPFCHHLRLYEKE